MKNNQTPNNGNSPDKNKENSSSHFEWKRAGKTSLIWISVILFAVYVSGVLTESNKKEVEIEYTVYKDYLRNKDIDKAVIIGNVFHGEFKLPQPVNTSIGKLDNITNFKLTLPFVDRSVTDEWDSAGLKYTFKEKTIDWTGYLLNMLPWLLLIGFWISAPTDRGMVYLSKVITSFCFLMISEFFFIFPFVVLLGISTDFSLVQFFTVLVLGSGAIVSIGCLISGLTLRSQLRDMLIPILLFPLVTPVVISATKSTLYIFENQPIDQWSYWLLIMFTFFMIYGLIGFLVFDYIVEE